MAGNILNGYAASVQAITCTLASLASGSQRQSAAVDNSTNLYPDALVQVNVKTGSTGSSTGYVDVYAAGSTDGGTNYSGGASGLDAAYSAGELANLVKLGRISAPGNVATTYHGGPWSVAAAFGGSMPQKWSIVVDNETGAALDATEGNHLKEYLGVFGTYS